jgi:hypothetical protein
LNFYFHSFRSGVLSPYFRDLLWLSGIVRSGSTCL